MVFHMLSKNQAEYVVAVVNEKVIVTCTSCIDRFSSKSEKLTDIIKRYQDQKHKHFSNSVVFYLKDPDEARKFTEGFTSRAGSLRDMESGSIGETKTAKCYSFENSVMEFIAIVGDGLLMIIATFCGNHYTSTANGIDNIVKTYRTKNHRYVSDDIVVFHVKSDGDAERLMINISGGVGFLKEL